MSPHGKIPLNNREHQRLKVLKIVRFAEEVHWNESLDEATLKLTSSLDSFDNFLTHFLYIDMRPGPVSKFNEEGARDLHVKDVEHAIALLFNLGNLFF